MLANLFNAREAVLRDRIDPRRASGHRHIAEATSSLT